MKYFNSFVINFVVIERESSHRTQACL